MARESGHREDRPSSGQPVMAAGTSNLNRKVPKIYLSDHRVLIRYCSDCSDKYHQQKSKMMIGEL